MTDTLVEAIDYDALRVEFHLNKWRKDGGERKSPERWYTIDFRRVPSVTQILDTLNKGALPYWGQRVGTEGTLTLSQRGYDVLATDEPQITRWLLNEKLSVNHVKELAADRGKLSHDALANYATQGTIPSLMAFRGEDRGYVRALAKWLLEAKPTFLASEVMVGSLEYGYAGRYDLRVEIDGRVGLLDLKTSKGVWFETYFPQLAAYEYAAWECGADPTDFQAVLRLDADGTWELEESCATLDDFLEVKRAYDAQQSLKDRVKRARKERREQAKTSKSASDSDLGRVQGGGAREVAA